MFLKERKRVDEIILLEKRWFQRERSRNQKKQIKGVIWNSLGHLWKKMSQYNSPTSMYGGDEAANRDFFSHLFQIGAHDSKRRFKFSVYAENNQVTKKRDMIPCES